MDQKRNQGKMPPWSPRAISEPVHQHFDQTPSHHQPGQIRPRIGQELHTPNPPQRQSAHFPETVQLTRSTHAVHRTEPGRMAQAGRGPAIQLQLQLTHLLRSKETRPGTPDHIGLPVAQPALPHRQVLYERDQQMYRRHWTGQFVHLHNSRPYFWILANETGSRFATTNRLHNPKPRTISLDHFTHGTTRMPGKFPKIDGTSSAGTATHPDLHR